MKIKVPTTMSAFSEPSGFFCHASREVEPRRRMGNLFRAFMQPQNRISVACKLFQLHQHCFLSTWNLVRTVPESPIIPLLEIFHATLLVLLLVQVRRMTLWWYQGHTSSNGPCPNLITRLAMNLPRIICHHWS